MLIYDKMEFTINLRKSQIISTQKINFLGFQIDLVKIIFTSADDRKHKLKSLILQFLRIQRPSKRFLAKFIETVISCILALKLGPFFYRNLENNKYNFKCRSKTETRMVA